jgi:hypothetical protein
MQAGRQACRLAASRLVADREICRKACMQTGR